MNQRKVKQQDSSEIVQVPGQMTIIQPEIGQYAKGRFSIMQNAGLQGVLRNVSLGDVVTSNRELKAIRVSAADQRIDVSADHDGTFVGVGIKVGDEVTLRDGTSMRFGNDALHISSPMLGTYQCWVR